MVQTLNESRTSAWADGSEGLEKTQLKFGFIPLSDCAPLVIALEKGYFSRYGLEVELSREMSWANIRDKVATGILDGAQMLAAMPIAASLDIGAVNKPTVTAFSMDLNGNAITVSNHLYRRMQDADPEAMQQRPLSAHVLKKVIDDGKARGNPPMTFAMVYPMSTHNYELRYWMASAGIVPDKDIHLVVTPPTYMVDSLIHGNIDGFCVGEPWNERAVRMGVGHTLITSYEIWNNKPEKVFAVNQDWARRNPHSHKAVVMALIDAARWIDQPENRSEVVKIISGYQYVDAPEDDVRMSMTGTFQYAPDEAPQPLPDFNVFYRYAASFPWRSHAVWLITQMYRWGQLEEVIDICKTAAQVYRPDIYREAATELGVAYPHTDYKTEGLHREQWLLEDASVPIPMGPDCFHDGKVFDPAKLIDYLDGFDIHNMTVSLDDLGTMND